MFVDVRDNLHVTKFDKFNVKKIKYFISIRTIIVEMNVNEIICKIIRYMKYNLCYESFLCMSDNCRRT